MRPISFDKLMNWILEEKRSKGTIFGIREFYKANSEYINLFEQKLENPIGPAAGPHTQLAQNIIAAYCAGSRFFELKTVQVIDGEDLPVSKPCISAPDEGYNVEWSTELTVPCALDEYIKAWFAIKLLSKEYSLGDDDGFIFNMSVGYDLNGIKSEKINSFIDNIKDAKNTEIWQECKKWANENINKFKNVNILYVNEISSKICTSITLSTLHGCPPDEIERIANYLLTEKGLNTFIKCNPTLLGYAFTRKTMDNMGYGYLEFDEHHFKNDLQFDDAVPMLKRLQKLANSRGLDFGVKLTNTFPVKICKNELPGDEMYMSGRSLYPLSMNLAYKLSEAFNGKLRISYSGGADIFNIKSIFETGIYPITLATSILKPGGYERFIDLANEFKNMKYRHFKGIDVKRLKSLAESSLSNPHNIKNIKPELSRKINEKVPKLDCFIAPCNKGCPINQDVPQYLRLVGEGKYLEAFKIIVDRNPLPFITGTICNHRCMSKCTRNFYEDSIKIRDMKLVAAQSAFDTFIKSIKKEELPSHKTVAIVGGGPAGLSAAYFLSRNGIGVTIFDKNPKLGGTVASAIPDFRIPMSSIENDVKLIMSMDINVELNTEIKSYKDLKELGYKYIIFATGALKRGELNLNSNNTINAIDFLEQYKSNYEKTYLGKNVVIIGGGNTAMDAARAAKRVKNVENVYIIYRRTKKYMPADEEEIKLALEDGIEIKELLSPELYKDSVLICRKVVLGELDNSGRRLPIETEEKIKIHADSVITAVGEKIDDEFFKLNDIDLDTKGNVIVNKKTLETNIENIFVAGDAFRGPSTVVDSIHDANVVVDTILLRENSSNYENLEYVLNECEKIIRSRKGKIKEAKDEIKAECDRCLECSTICENCVSVCPNRANVTIKSESLGTQILHIDSMCNECGNCETFCPYDSAPYKEKLTLFTNEDDFENSTNEGFLIIDKKLVKKRVNDIDVSEMIDAIIKDYSWML